ncbi:hypothetical protein B484DRAFT_445593 [Ochromonadaceae sp. CCMP2298]|nr:hypothetical protein B484DRAFT_448116 [Ochromonadaceae sp. CCMP2298]KAJ1436605.1 hypothetical protein B484DRAFT_445593 [Ochromonadaceae sp. CCMP2298]
MAEVAMSPEIMLGKRRTAMDDEFADPMESVCRTKKVRVTNRNSYVSSSSETPSNSYSFADVGRSSEEVNAFVGSAFKRTRVEFGGPNETDNAKSEQYLRYHESVVASLRMESQMSLARKDQEIQHVVAQNKQMQERLVAVLREQSSVEENKLLKKAVAIQDSRYRELAAQHHQLQQVVGPACERIQQLEQINQELTDQLYAVQYGNIDAFRPPGPPDVY